MTFMTKPGTIIKIQLFQGSKAKDYFESKERFFLGKHLKSKYITPNQTFDYRSKSIRYAGIINEYGRTLTGMVRPNTIPLWTAEQVKNEFFIISTLMTLRKSYATKVGILDFMHLSHPKVTILAFQRKNITYYVSIDVKTKNIETLVSKIKRIL